MEYGIHRSEEYKILTPRQREIHCFRNQSNWNPRLALQIWKSKSKDKTLEPNEWNLESKAWNPESKNL